MLRHIYHRFTFELFDLFERAWLSYYGKWFRIL